jgi:hypothetical protein
MDFKGDRDDRQASRGRRAQNEEERRLLREPWKFGQPERAAALLFERRRYEST